jgi:hypothetical protein
MFTSAVPIRRLKIALKDQGAGFGPFAEMCPFFFGALEVVLPIK